MERGRAGLYPLEGGDHCIDTWRWVSWGSVGWFAPANACWGWTRKVSLVLWAMYQGASHPDPTASSLLCPFSRSHGGHGDGLWLWGAHPPACRVGGCSRKRSPDAVRCDPKLASHSLPLSCVSSARLIGLKKKKALVTEISSSDSESTEGADLLNKATLLL